MGGKKFTDLDMIETISSAIRMVPFIEQLAGVSTRGREQRIAHYILGKGNWIITAKCVARGNVPSDPAPTVCLTVKKQSGSSQAKDQSLATVHGSDFQTLTALIGVKVTSLETVSISAAWDGPVIIQDIVVSGVMTDELDLRQS